MASNKKYIYGFDLLRGLCAIFVATYHMLGWENIIDFTAVGYYGVYIFFILSGFAIHYQYSDRLYLIDDLKIFYILRFVRLLPLLLVVVVYQYKGTHLFSFDYANIILTLSLLFGFAMPGATSAVTGGWSLGIEFGFYLIYPFLLNLLRSWRIFFLMVFVFEGLRILFIKVAYSTFENYFWYGYTQILPFLIFFFAGMGLAKYVLEEKINTQYRYTKILSFLSIPSLCILFFWRDVSHKYILDGHLGLILTLYSLIIVFIFSFFRETNETIRSICKFFGEISYGVYLIHPLVYFGIKSQDMGFQWKVPIVLMSSCTLSYVLNRFVESPIRLHIKKFFLDSRMKSNELYAN